MLTVVGTRSNSFGAGKSDGKESCRTTRTFHFVPIEVDNIVLCYGNHYNGETVNTNPIKVKCSIEVEEEIYPIFFNGKREVEIDGGGLIYSDPVRFEEKKLYVRTKVSGLSWPRGLKTNRPGEGNNVNEDVVDNGIIKINSTTCYSPLSILSETAEKKKSVAIIGDSIINGAGDDAEDGFVLRAFNDQIPFVKLSRAGEKACQFMGKNRRIRSILAAHCTHLICNYGTNDLGNRTAEEIKSNLADIYKFFSPNLRIYQCTLLPKINRSDDSFSSPEYVRRTVNDWIRSKPQFLDGVIDTDLIVSRNGKWKDESLHYDGIHPSTLGHILLSNALNGFAL